jgi:hypothetical protein
VGLYRWGADAYLEVWVCAGGEGNVEARRIAEAVQSALEGSLRAPLAATGGSLLRALDSPSAEMRILVRTLHQLN